MQIWLRRIAVIGYMMLFLGLLTQVALAENANGISSPRSHAVLKDIVVVRGVATHTQFRKWQLDLLIYKNLNRATFLALGEKPITADTDLITWDTTLYPDGDHILRLRVVYSSLNYDEYFLPITIRNDEVVVPVVIQKPISFVLPQSAIAAPIQPTNLSDNRWIEIDLSDQRLFAWQDDVQILETTVSTGRAEYPTVIGTFRIRTKLNSTRMRGPGYDTPDVPWTMYFFRGYAIHGTYWHNDFGIPVSHGCVNLPVDDAKQLFDWAQVGTKVVVHQ